MYAIITYNRCIIRTIFGDPVENMGIAACDNLGINGREDAHQLDGLVSLIRSDAMDAIVLSVAPR